MLCDRDSQSKTIFIKRGCSTYGCDRTVAARVFSNWFSLSLISSYEFETRWDEYGKTSSYKKIVY